MKKALKFSVLIFALMLISGCNKTYMKEISYDEYKKLLENEETFILEVMRTECSACINFEPKIKQVANDYKIEIKYINTDNLTTEEEDSLYKDTGISGTPTVLFYKNGKEETKASRINGSVSVDKIISKFKANGFLK